MGFINRSTSVVPARWKTSLTSTPQSANSLRAAWISDTTRYSPDQTKDLRRRRLHESIDCILRLAGLFTPRRFTRNAPASRLAAVLTVLPCTGVRWLAARPWFASASAIRFEGLRIDDAEMPRVKESGYPFSPQRRNCSTYRFHGDRDVIGDVLARHR
jgi:hypothetical protein